MDCGRSGRPVCKGVVELKMSCSTKTQDQRKDRRGGTLRWVENRNDELAYFDNESEINSSITKRNIVFTLQDRYEPQAGRHIYCSTAVGNKITESLTIGCSDGTDAKYCHISVIGKCTQQSKNSVIYWVTSRVHYGQEYATPSL